MKQRDESKWRGGEERRAVDFLLDKPVAGRAELERRFLSDPAYLAYIESIETELIEAYLDDELTETDRVAFEARYNAANPHLKRKLLLIQRFRKQSQRRRIIPLAGVTLVAACLGAGWAIESRTSADLRASADRKVNTPVEQQPMNTIAEVRLGGPVSRSAAGNPMPLVIVHRSDVLLRVVLPPEYAARTSHVRILDEMRRVVVLVPSRPNGVADVPGSALPGGDYFVEILRGKDVIAERTMSVRAELQ